MARIPKLGLTICKRNIDIIILPTDGMFVILAGILGALTAAYGAHKFKKGYKVQTPVVKKDEKEIKKEERKSSI